MIHFSPQKEFVSCGTDQKQDHSDVEFHIAASVTNKFSQTERKMPAIRHCNTKLLGSVVIFDVDITVSNQRLLSDKGDIRIEKISFLKQVKETHI